jgi:two-component system KDP operon response regulator KdpE
MKILLIEDNSQITEAISLCFELRLPEVSVISVIEGNRSAKIVRDESPDIVILDLNLPDIDGFTVLHDIRSFSNVPIIILSVNDDEIYKVKALELGADDYLVKPFSHVELLARVKAALRHITKRPTRKPAKR